MTDDQRKEMEHLVSVGDAAKADGSIAGWSTERQLHYWYSKAHLQEEEIKNQEASFVLRWSADMRAIKMWHDAGNPKLIWPDHADLCVWLLEQLEKAKRK